MSECEPLSRPTWVLGVIPVTGALNSCWKSCKGFSFSTNPWILLTAHFSLPEIQVSWQGVALELEVRIGDPSTSFHGERSDTAPLPTPWPPLLSHPLFGQHKEIALNTLACWCLSFCFSYLLLATRAV